MQHFHEATRDAIIHVKHGTRTDDARYTLAVAIDPDTKVVSYAYAITDPRDQFSRKIGRSIAKGRALRLLTSAVQKSSQSGRGTLRDVSAFADSILQYELLDEALNQWVERLVEDHLAA